MIDTRQIEVKHVSESRLPKVDFDNLPFGRVFSDHMLIARYDEGEWKSVSIEPYGNLSLSPATSMIHYGQSIFEGLKAFRNDNDEILVFRPESNWERMNKSAERLCMPAVPREYFVEGIRQLVELDRAWVPNRPESSLYIRPFLFATDEMLGVKPSESYIFMIITSPVGPYYANPLHLKIETEYTRAAPGGVGAAKAAGNYASALYPAKLAQEQGIDQLIWTDAKEHRFLEEAGTMNMMVVIDGTLITPKLSSTILPGVTRNSVLKLAEDRGITTEERDISVDELLDAHRNGTLQEVFGVGTAATIAHVVKLTHNDEIIDLPPIQSRKVSTLVGTDLLDIKMGNAPDPYGWNMRI